VTVGRARVTEILAALEAAGDGWPAVARRLPEFARLHRGRPLGPGVVRPWVVLSCPHEGWPIDLPVRLILHETGVWFVKGTTINEIERKARGRHNA
jgi:hypothetical protein